MKTTVKNISDTKVELTISLDKQELADAELVAVKKISHNLKVAGFRKGKAPHNVAVKNINPNDLQEQLINDAISKAVASSFIENNIQALDRPAVSVKKFVPNEALEFTAEAEVLPKIKLGNYKKLKSKKDKAEVSEADINEIIDRFRKGMSEKKEVDRAAKLGDEAVIDFVGKKDGVAFDGGTGSDYKLELGAGQFIPGFEEGIIGHKKGEEFDLDLTFPEDYHAEHLKGAKVVFTTTLKAVNESTMPELNDELAAKAGPFKTAKDLIDDVKRELMSQKEREINEKLKDDLVSQLIEISEVAVPDILAGDQAQRIEQDFRNNLMYQGLTLEKYIEDKKFDSKDKWLEVEVMPLAKKRVQAGLVLAELSKVEKIEASESEVDERIEALKKQYAKNADALKQLATEDVRHDIMNSLLTEKAVDRLVELNSK